MFLKSEVSMCTRILFTIPKVVIDRGTSLIRNCFLLGKRS